MYAINTLLHLSLHKPLNHWNNSVLLTLRAEVCVRLKAASVQGLFPFVAGDLLGKRLKSEMSVYRGSTI